MFDVKMPASPHTPALTQRLPLLLFALLLAGILGVQTLIYLQYNLQWIDTDQFFMWTGVRDYADGHFYEPRFYAQNYNTFLEALLAVPFYKLGLPVYQALPLATNLLFIFPVLSSALILFRSARIWQSLAFLAFILCMNPAYFLLNAQPRGFVTGLFFCSFYLKSFIHPENKNWLSFNTAAGVLGYFVNPNSLLLTVPLFCFLFFHHYRKSWYYWRTGIVALLFVVFDLFFNHFYRLHPDYIKTELIMDFGWRYLLENLSQPDRIFAQLCPFAEQQYWWLFLPFAVLISAMIRQRKKAMLLAFSCVFVFLLLSLAVSKTRDGSTWVYLSYSRMYLALPLLLAMGLSSITIIRKEVVWLVLSLAFVNLGTTLLWQKDRLKPHFDPASWNALYLIDLETALDASRFYGQKCKENKVDFMLVSHRFWAVNPICYGGPALDSYYPQTMETTWDKRYVVRRTYEEQVLPEFILLSTTNDIATKLSGHKDFDIIALDAYGLALVTHNTLPLNRFIALEKIHEMPY